MNNKGFTLTELLVALVIISVAAVVVAKQIESTLSVTKNSSYEIMKTNLVKAADLYIKECENKINNCNITWNNNKYSFKAGLLKEKGYYSDLTSPIDNKELDNCLIIESEKNNSTINTIIIDNCY